MPRARPLGLVSTLHGPHARHRARMHAHALAAFLLWTAALVLSALYTWHVVGGP